MSFWNTFVNQDTSSSYPEIEDIKYHLTRLFEAEAPLVDIDPLMWHCQRSNLKFGIEDVQLLSASLDKTQLAIKIESWITHFEPRLSNVMVELLEPREGENALFFNIVATVKTRHGNKRLVFDSKIALNNLLTKLEEDSYD